MLLNNQHNELRLLLTQIGTQSDKRITFKRVPTESIFPNPEGNPRRNIKQKDIDKLCDSIIACDGILVPLVVFPGPEKDTFFLLDGERRLTAAKKLGLKEVPVNILPKELAGAENLATMFTIHMARVPWNTMARAMALNQFLKMKPEFEKDRKALRHITAMSSYEINNAILVRMFPEELQLRAVYSDKPNGLEPSYLIELAKVIEAAEEMGISKTEDRSEVIRSFVSKIGNVVHDPYQLKDLRNILSNIPKKEADGIFKTLMKKPEQSISQYVLEYQNRVSGLRSIHVPRTKCSTKDALTTAKIQWQGLLLSLATLKDAKLSPSALREINNLLDQTASAVKELC